MRLFSVLSSLVLLFLNACSGGEDTGSGDSADTDTDTDTDTDVDDTAPDPTGIITGSVVAYDGPIGGVEVQACVTVCFSTAADSSGVFTFTGLGAGDYKVDAVGEAVDGKDYGRIRVNASLVDDASTWTSPSPLFLPQMFGPTVVASAGTYTFGPVAWTVDPSILTIDPIGHDPDTYWVGVVPGADVGAFWEVTPSLAVAFNPLATGVAGTFTLSITTDTPAGEYDVYSVDLHGELEGPVGTATADGTTVTASASPSVLTWLLFVPKA